MELIETEAIVIGAGVVGVAIARELSKNNIETILIDKNNYIGEEVSARNSGVIHAGFYYPPETLKAKFCNLGNKSIYNYCNDRSIYAKKTGKILVSSDKNSLSVFKNYKENAIKAGGQQLELLSKSELTDLEPNVSCLYGLLSPETGVLDVHAYISSLENDFLKSGGVTSLKSELLSVSKNSNSFLSLLSNSDENFTIKSKIVIMATGLHSDNFFNKLPIDTKSLIKNINYSKGHYYKLSGKSPFKHLIYPLPTKFGLGIHAGFDIDGSIRFGPDTSRSSEISYKFDSGIKEKFVEAISEYWPGLDAVKLHEDYVGIRPKIQKSSESFADFSILGELDHGVENFIFLQGIESPGLTCSLPIAKFVCNLLK